MLENKTLEIIKRVMNIQEVTGRELAEKMGVTEVTVSRWLTGARKMTIVDFERILKILGLKEVKLEGNEINLYF